MALTRVRRVSLDLSSRSSCQISMMSRWTACLWLHAYFAVGWTLILLMRKNRHNASDTMEDFKRGKVRDTLLMY